MSGNTHLKKFMEALTNEALTFDDVTLLTRYADFLPNDADISSRLTSRIRVNMPFLSAAMDTVTESRMAIAMAMLGGIGVIHKNLEPAEQTRMIRAVKHHLNGLIAHPITFRTSDTLQTVSDTRQAKGYSFSGFPIIDDADNLVGIMTTADIKFASDESAPVTAVMTRKVITAEAGTTLKQAYDIMLKHKIGKLPLVENNKLVGLYSFTDVNTLIKEVQPMYNRDAKYRLRVAAAVGPNDQQRVEMLAKHD